MPSSSRRSLVLASYVIAPQPLELSFNRAEIGSLFMAVLLGIIVAGDGRSNWFKGVQLVTVYVMIALMFYLMPDIVPDTSGFARPSRRAAYTEPKCNRTSRVVLLSSQTRV